MKRILRPIRSIITKLMRRRLRRALRKTEFWCDAHWAMIDEVGAHPGLATVAVAAGLAMIGAEYKSTKHGCCYFTDDTIRGVLALCLSTDTLWPSSPPSPSKTGQPSSQPSTTLSGTQTATPAPRQR